MKKKSLIFALVLSATLAGGVLRPAMADYANIKEAIQDSANPRTYTLNGSETLTSNLGTMGGAGSTLTIDSGSPDYSIIGKNGSTQYNGVTVNSGQTLILQNIGKATISDTDYSISDVAGIQNLRQAIINNGTLTIKNVVFNKLVSQTSAAIINNANAKITNITGKFLNSGNLEKPPVIYSSAKSSIIERISADFINNKGNQGGAISTMNGGTIDKIVDSRFILNEAKRAAGAIRNGETVNNYGGTVNIESSEFKYNYSRAEGGAIVNDYSDAVAGSVMTIKNSVFENNFNVADRPGYGGGAIFHNGKLLELTDTNFKDNITHGDGGALLLNSLTYINADNSDVIFSGNKSKVASISNFNGLNTTYTDDSNTRYNDIYLREGNLYLNANANKSITFDGTLENDSSKNNALFINSDSTIKGGVYNFNNSVSAKNLNIFNGANVKFGSAAQADGTTSYGSLNTQNFTNDTNGGTLDFLNSHIESNTLGNANLNGILNTKIDVDFTNAQSDSFKITGGDGGTINIGAIHFIDENISTNVENEKTITILDDSVDKVDLTRTSYTNPEVIGTKETKVLDVKPTAYWDEKFNDIIYSQDVKGAIVLHNSYGDKKDSIKVTVTGFGDSTPIGRVASDKDTLAALNKYVTTEDRAFTANTSSPNYTATEDLGETTAGKFTISGVDGSVLNLGSHTGFELANETTLNLNSLELTGSNPAIAVSNSNAKVNINDVKLNSDITGTTNFDLTTTGDNTVSATITKANIINSGDLTVTKNNAFSDVNLQSSGGSLNLSSGRVESQNFGKVVLSGDTNFAVDADLANVVSDNISATEFEGSGYFSINKINILSDSVVETVRTLVANDVLKAHVKLATTVDITRPSAKDYVITYDDGYLTFTNENPNFVKIARNNAISRSYNMKADVNIANDIADIGDSSTSIGTMGGNVGAEFTVNGNNNYSIDGAGKGGIIIGSGRTLNVNNVGSLNTDGTVKAAWKGFNDAIFTLNSDGVLNFMGENVIANNSTTASKNIITNIAGKVNFSEGAKLNLIDNTYGSSLIYNYDGIVGNINGIIDKNKINKNNNYYGLIYNGSSDADKISKMGDISGTISNNTLKGTNVYGGTIINISKGTSEIGNISADITGNSVTASTGLYGGLIRNESEGGNLKIGDISGKIENNSLVINSVIYGALISNKATNGGKAEIGKISSPITNNTISSNSSNQETTGLISNEGNSNGLSNISAITGGILNNTLNLASRRLLGGLVYNFAKTYTASIGDISGKLNNNIINVNGTNGGVIFNGAEGAYNSEIADVTGEISGNKITSVGGNSINGGLIYNYSKSTGVAKMGDISANITDNIVTAESLVTGGLLYNCKGSSTIEGVSGNVSGNTVITSGEIEGGLINNEGSIGLISGDFTNNYIESTANKVSGGLIYNESGSRAVLTSDITGNYIKSAKPSESNGAVLGNMASMTIKDSSITNNASNMLNTISNRGTLNIIADTKDVLFEGNKVKATINRDESTGEVTVSGGEEIDIRNTSNGVLNLYTSQGKTITFNGAITDENNLGTTKVGGTYNDGTGETAYAGNVIFNNTVTQKTLNMANNSVIKLGADDTKYGLLKLNNFTNDTNGGLIDTTNSHFDEQNFGSTTLNSNLNFNFDLNLANLETDTITANYSNGSGKIILSDVNPLGTKSWGDFLESELGTKIKILNSNSDSLQLGLSSTLANTLSAAQVSFGTEEISRTDDTILATTNWEYDKYKTTIIEEDKYGQWELSKTSTENDSLEFKGTEIEKTRYETMGDTLMLVNQDTTKPTKNFNAVNDGDTYNVTANLGTTNGTVNINGITGGSTETINLNGKTGFELSTAASELNFNDVTVGDSTKTPAQTTVATVTNGNAKISLNNTTLNGNINSDVNYNLALNGTTNVNGTVDNANATLSGTTSKLTFNTDTFKNAILNAQEGTINTKNGVYENYDIGKLISSDTSRYSIDMTLSQDSHQSDTFVVGPGSTGTIYVTFSSDAITDDMPDDQSVYIQIIKASGGSGPELDYDGSKILTFAQAVMNSGNLIAKEHGLYTKDTTNDSIMLRGVQEVFKAWTNLETTDHKEFTFNEDANYVIANTINLDGNDNAEIINNGTVTNNGQLSEFTLTNNGNFTTDAEKIATTGNTITNNGTLTFTGGDNANSISKTDGTNSKVIFSGASANSGVITQDNVEITSSGNVTNNALITATAIQNDGTLSSSASNLSGTITNDGTLNLTSGINNNVIKNTASSNGIVNLSGVTQNNKNITANEINNTGNAFENASGAILTGNITNSGAMTANADDLHDTDSSIMNNGILTLNGGANTNAITASVATSTVNFENVTSNSATVTANEINNTTTGDIVLSNTGSLKSTTFTNDGKFTNTGSGKITATDIVNNANGTLTSSAQNLAGAVNNLGTLNLSGTLDKTISGSGTTYVDSALKLNSGANIDGTLDGNNGNITISSGSVTNHNIGALKGNGNYALDILYSTSGDVSIDTITLANDTTDSATVKITALNEGGSRPKNFEKQVLIGANENTRLDISAIKQQFDNEFTDDKERTVDLETPTINWDDNYGTEKWTETYKQELSVTGSSAGLYDTLKYATTLIDESAHIFDPKSDNLHIINIYDGTGSNNRSMNFAGIHDDTTANGTYTVQTDLGTSTAGTLTLNGVKDGDKNTTVDLNTHSGFVLDNATTLDINNIDMKGNSTLITVNNENASVKLNNTNMQGAITGSKEYNMIATGDNTIQDVTKAKVSNSGNLSLSGTNDLVNITGANGTTEITGGTTTVGNVNQKSVTIDSAATKLVVTNGITTTDGVTNNKTNGLEVQGGVIGSDISGTGKTVINGTNVAVKYGNKIEQDIVINENKKLVNTSVTAIKGKVENNGDIQLYSQDNSSLTKNISGSGTAEFNQKVTIAADVENAINIKTYNNNNADITVESGHKFGTAGKDITIDAANKLTMQDIADAKGNLVNNGDLVIQSGTLTKAISGDGTTQIDGSLTLDDASSIEGTLDLNEGNVTISPNAITEHSVGALKGDGNFALDIDYSASPILSDTITITNDSRDSATVKITSLTESGTRPTDFEKQILFGANPNTKLDISAIKSQFDMAADEVQKSVAKDLTAPEINWNDDYGTENWTETYKRELSVIGSTAGLMDTIKYESTKIDESAHIFNPKADNLAIINQYNGSGKENREFNFDSAENEFKVTENTGVTESGNLTINGVADGDARSTIDYDSHSGFELNNDNTTVTLKNVEVKNSSALVSGTAGNGVKVVLDNVNIHDNGSGIQTAGDVEIKGNSTIADDINVTGDNSQINIDGTDVVNLDKNLTGNGTSKLNISNGTVNIGENARISELDTTLNNTSLNIANENSLNGLDTTFNGTNNLNISNNKVGTLALGNANLNGVLRMQVDADLANAQMDKLTAASASIGSKGRIEVSKINLLSPTTQKRLDLLFTNNKDLASVVNYTGEGQIAYSPIYKYNTSYIQKSNGSGYFSFVTPGNRYDDFNPSVMASSVTAIVTGYQNQMQSLHDGFYHMDRYMKHSKALRFASENQNKVASLAPVTNLDTNKIPETSQAMWTLPYSTFEKVNLKGGVKVDNIAYGMTYGGDSDMFEMGRGFKGLLSAFVGYNGNHMNYDGISMTQNGGFLGATFNAYKGNFFTGLTVSTGASSGDADTMYGHENITLLTAGVANKTGYNFEFKEGKIIIQPSLFLGYTWVNTFDHTNPAGVRINQDALNALQIVPGVKVIGNTKNGWQPYAGIDMVWNVFMGRNQVTASDVVLPKLSERAYVQYGVGVQKTWADKFTGFLQAMVRNGGRNGIVLSAGLRWTFGKNNKNNKNNGSNSKKVIKKLK